MVHPNLTKTLQEGVVTIPMQEKRFMFQFEARIRRIFEVIQILN